MTKTEEELDAEIKRLDKEIAVAEKEKTLKAKRNELKAMGGTESTSNLGKSLGFAGKMASKFFHWMTDK